MSAIDLICDTYWTSRHNGQGEMASQVAGDSYQGIGRLVRVLRAVFQFARIFVRMASMLYREVQGKEELCPRGEHSHEEGEGGREGMTPAAVVQGGPSDSAP